MMRLAVIAPGMQAGGANLLLARVASQLARFHGWQIVLVDYKGGAAERFLAAQGIPFRKVDYVPGEMHDMTDADAVLISLLGAKLLARRYRLRPGARLLAWCTAPQDPFKFFAAAMFFNRSSWRVRRLLARTAWRVHGLRIRRFLAEGSTRGGVMFMDRHTLEVNCEIFGGVIAPSVVPICTGEPTAAPRQSHGRLPEAFWVGRIADFKTEPMIASTRAVLESGMASKVIAIGDGSDVRLAGRRLHDLPVEFIGHVEPDALDKLIRSRAAFVFGHATALLEAARNGVPSLLVDGCYDPIPPGLLRLDWLHRAEGGYVGKICRPAAMFGRPIDEVAAESSQGFGDLGLKDHLHWLAHHHPSPVSAKVHTLLLSGDYTVADFLESGAAMPGPAGRAADWAKEWLFKRIY